jgi:hypothetical protein
MFDQLAILGQLEARGNGLAAPLQKPQAPAEFAADQCSFPRLANGLLLVLSGPVARRCVVLLTRIVCQRFLRCRRLYVVPRSGLRSMRS